MSTTSIQIDLPTSAVEGLKRQAQAQQQTITDMVRDIVLQQSLALPPVPAEFKDELEAMSHLSDRILWVLARDRLTAEEEAEFEALNVAGQQRPLTTTEQTRQEELRTAYEQMVLRRARAAVLLQGRGYDLSDPSILH